MSQAEVTMPYFSLKQVSESTLLDYFKPDIKLSNAKKAKFLRQLCEKNIIFVNRLGFEHLLAEFIQENNITSAPIEKSTSPSAAKKN